MGMDETMIVAGIGSRKGVAATAVLAAIDAALAAHGLTRDQIDRLATAPLKRDEPALHAASVEIGLELVVVDDAALSVASPRTLTRSELSLAMTGAPSVSEASALAAAGPASRLLGPRLVVGSVTCAIAVSEETEGQSPLPPLRRGFAAPPLPHSVRERKGAKPSTQAPFPSPNNVGGEVASRSDDGVGVALPGEALPGDAS
jgi:cobalt-precorrin 5A hydrolase